MLTNYHTLAFVVSSLASLLQGRTIREVFSQEKDELVVDFDGMDASLCVSCHRMFSTMYLHPGLARAKKNTAAVLIGAVGKRVESLRIHPGDREVIMALDSDETIIVQLFGGKSNVILVGKEGITSDAFKRAKALIGTRYKSTDRELVYDVAGVDDALAHATASRVAGALKDRYPTLGPTVIREVLFRSGVNEAAASAELDAPQRTAIKHNLAGILAELAAPHPRVYVRQDGEEQIPEVFSIIHLSHCSDLEERRFDNVHEAIRYFVFRSHATQALDRQKMTLTHTLTNQVEKARRTLEALHTTLGESDRAAEYEQAGTLLLAHLGELRKGMRNVTLNSNGDTVTVRLDEKLPPARNAQAYFDKAKKAKLARSQSEMRLSEITTRLDSGEQLLTAIADISSREGLKDFMNDHAGELEGFGLGEKAKSREMLPFRIFTVEGGFEVWAGKSSGNNDLLTMKYAKPNDLWFHARGSSGSHVILKTASGKGEPGKRAKEQAAGIAAYYSKMKNAKLVPVAMTEKKYVRKPKGAPPGTVTLEREKVLFAEPGLPSMQNKD